MKSEFIGGILAVREVEDCIRATKKYTKGVFRRKVQHPVQGEDFPSKVVTEYYEVYPDMELNWDMPATDFWAWVWGDTPHIDLGFHYDYRQNEAKVEIGGGNGVVVELSKAIPGFSDALTKVVLDGRIKK